MRILSFICCEIAIQDVRLNTISFINLLEEITSIAFPIAIPRLTAFAYLEREAHEPDVQEARLRAELNGQVLLDHATTAHFQDKLRTRIIGEMQGFPVTAPGDLKVSFHMGEPLTEVAAWMIKVAPVGAPRVDVFAGQPGGPA